MSTLEVVSVIVFIVVSFITFGAGIVGLHMVITSEAYQNAGLHKTCATFLAAVVIISLAIAGEALLVSHIAG
jgi:hypothetical protein